MAMDESWLLFSVVRVNSLVFLLTSRERRDEEEKGEEAAKSEEGSGNFAIQMTQRQLYCDLLSYNARVSRWRTETAWP